MELLLLRCTHLPINHLYTAYYDRYMPSIFNEMCKTLEVSMMSATRKINWAGKLKCIFQVHNQHNHVGLLSWLHTKKAHQAIANLLKEVNCLQIPLNFVLSCKRENIDDASVGGYSR